MPIEFLGITVGRKPPQPAAGQPARTRRDDEEVGSVGTVYYSGFLDGEEYNKDLQGSKALEIFERMHRSDAQVIAIIRAIVAPIRGAALAFDPASEDEKDVAIAHACERALTEMGGQVWDDFIRESVTGNLVYGHSVFEPVYTTPDGAPNIIDLDGMQVLAPYKFAPRLQRTIYRWHIDSTGTLRGVQQRAFVGTLDPETKIVPGDTSGALPYSASGQYKFIDIPVERLLVFSLEREGANYRGVSVLRSAYQFWWYKLNFMRMQGLALERHGVGTPYAIVKAGIKKAEENAIVSMLRNLHAHEKGYAIVNEAQLAKGTDVGMDPIGFLDMPTLGANARAFDMAIKYCDRQMAVSVEADFLTMGDGSGGNANVMHRDKSSLFFSSLRGVTSNFEDTMQRQWVVPFVALNWPGVKPPKLHLTGIDTKDIERIGTALANMARADLIHPDAKLENELREMMELSPLPEDDEGNPYVPGTPDDPDYVPPPAPVIVQPPDDQNAVPLSERGNGHRNGKQRTRPLADGAGEALAAIRERIAGAMQKDLVQFFESQASRVVAQLRQFEALKTLVDFTADDVFPEGEDEALQRALRAGYLAADRAVWRYWQDALGLGPYDANSAITERILMAGAQRVVGINDETRQAIRDVIGVANDRGYSLFQVVSGVDADGFLGLRSTIEETYKNRAEAVARTEAGYATNDAALARYDEAGVTEVDIIDGEGDEECASRNGTRVPISEHPDLAHPHCTILVIPVVPVAA